MEVKKILEHAMSLLDQRGKEYGDGIEQNFARAAQLATLKLNKWISPYDVAIIMESVKDARRATSPDHYDSHVDGLNYKAFAWALRQGKKQAQEVVLKRPRGRPRKHPLPVGPVVKRPRGRPRKSAT